MRVCVCVCARKCGWEVLTTLQDLFKTDVQQQPSQDILSHHSHLHTHLWALQTWAVTLTIRPSRCSWWILAAVTRNNIGITISRCPDTQSHNWCPAGHSPLPELRWRKRAGGEWMLGWLGYWHWYSCWFLQLWDWEPIRSWGYRLKCNGCLRWELLNSVLYCDLYIYIYI